MSPTWDTDPLGMNSPDSTRHDVPISTVSPAALQIADGYSSDSCSQSSIEEALAYFFLTFPDAQHPVRSLSIVLGRDAKVKETMDRSGEIWQDGNLVYHKTSNKRKRDAEDSDFSPGPPIVKKGFFNGDGDSFSLEGGIISTSNVRTYEEDETEEFLAIHLALEDMLAETPLSGVSKQHIRIYWKPEEGWGWTLQVLGRNGAHHNKDYLQQGQEVALKDGDAIGVKTLAFGFHLSGRIAYPDSSNDSDQSGSENSSETSSVTSSVAAFVKEQTSRKALRIIYNPDSNHVTAAVIPIADDESGADDEESGLEPASPRPPETLKVKQDGKRIKEKPSRRPSRKPQLDPKDLLMPGEDTIPTKRGPGRPPKNGQMSQREMRERLRMKAVQNGEDPSSKGKHGMRKPTIEGTEGKGLKKESTKRGRREAKVGLDASEHIGECSEDDARKGKVIPKAPPPSKEDFTEEQLKKPAENWHVRLCMILSDAATPMELYEIYEEMMRRWPFYRFEQSIGWQSSVRHNLLQDNKEPNGFFQKVSKDGRGNLWSMRRVWVPEMARRRSPVRSMPTYYPSTNPLPLHHARPMYNPGLPPYGYQSHQYLAGAATNGQPQAAFTQHHPLNYYPQYTGSSTLTNTLNPQQSPHAVPSPVSGGIAPTHNIMTASRTAVSTGIHSQTCPPPQTAPPQHTLAAIPDHALKDTAPAANGRPASPSIPVQPVSATNPARAQLPQSGRRQEAMSQMIVKESTSLQTPLRRGLLSYENSYWFHQILRGQIPSVFTTFRVGFRKNGHNERQAADNDKAATFAIDWILKNPYGRPEDVKDDHLKQSLVKILLRMLEQPARAPSAQSSIITSKAPSTTLTASSSSSGAVPMQNGAENPSQQPAALPPADQALPTGGPLTSAGQDRPAQAPHDNVANSQHSQQLTSSTPMIPESSTGAALAAQSVDARSEVIEMVQKVNGEDADWVLVQQSEA